MLFSKMLASKKGIFLSGFFAFALTVAQASILAENNVSDGQRKFAHSLYEQSAMDFEKALQKDSSNKTALLMAGWSYFKQGRYDWAQIKFAALLQLDSKSEDALEGLGWTSFKLGDYYNSLQTFQTLNKINKDHVGSLEGIAYNKFKLGDSAGAKKSLALALLYNPTSSDSHSILGYIALGEANYKEAVRHFRHANQLSKEPNPDLLTVLGNAYLALKKPECASHYFKKALKANPNHPGALAGTAQIPGKVLKKSW